MSDEGREPRRSDHLDASRLLDEARVCTVVVGVDGAIRYASAGLGVLLGSTPSALVGTSMIDWLVPEELELAISSLAAMAALPDAHNFPMVFHVRRVDGVPVEVDVMGTDLVQDPDVQGVVLTVIPADDRTRYVEPIRALASGADHATVVRLVAAGVGRGGHSLRPAAVVSFGPGGVELFGTRTTPELDEAIMGLMTDGSPVSETVRQLQPRALISIGRDHLAPGFAHLLAAQERAGVRIGAIGAEGRFAGVLLSAEPEAAWAGGAWTPSMEHHWHDLLDLATVAFERHRFHSRLVHAATHDSLTGVANRAHFLERLARLGTRHGLSVLYADLDRFKEINDQWGHARGDAVLAEIARRLHAAVRVDDLVARIGGDEFAVAVVDTPEPIVVELARRVHAAIVAPLPPSCGGGDVGVSIGVAHRGPEEPIDSVLARADYALLRVKRSGGDGGVDIG